eukprot:TRINITY_DN15941_c0_g1_i1.p1 TRINITY_DN15941_c0_g1~~TRINITY_DN15941_c0_g1_i1.p1  ORF type:complete len:405 (+),score=65.78 TRINITY_DN15941_c0_g1_i1:121-1335(+)
MATPTPLPCVIPPIDSTNPYLYVLDAASIWGQLANCCFLMSASFTDLILIRFWLCSAYIFLLIAASVGFPAWGDVATKNTISVDGIVWAACLLLLHANALYRHIHDELPVPKFKYEDDESIWRFFNRRCGMARLEYKKVLNAGSYHRFRAGECILSSDASLGQAFLVIEGMITGKRDDSGNDDKSNFRLLSGHVFDLYVFNIFGVRLGFEASHAAAYAKTDCYVFMWDLESLDAMANRSTLPIGVSMRNFVLYQIASEYNMRVVGEELARDSNGDPEDNGWLTGERSRDFCPFSAEETKPNFFLLRFIRWVWRSFGIFPPEGLQHLHPLPPSAARRADRMHILAQASGKQSGDVAGNKTWREKWANHNFSYLLPYFPGARPKVPPPPPFDSSTVVEVEEEQSDE